MRSPRNHLHTTKDFPQMTHIIFWNSFGFMFYGFMIPYVTSEYFEVSATIIGIIIASQPLGRLLITPLVGYLTDKSSKKRLVMIGSFGRTIAYTVMYFSIGFQSIFGFGVGVFLQGVIVGFFWPPFNALIAQKSSKYYRSEAYGKRNGAMGWGSGAGAILSFSIFVIGIYFLHENTWFQYSSLLIFAIINIFAGINFLKRVDENIIFTEPTAEMEPEHPTTEDSDKSKIIIVGLILLSITIIFSSMNEHISQPFMQKYMYDNLKLGTITVMIIVYVSKIISLIIAPLLGVYADRIGVIGFALVSFFGALVTVFLISTTILWIFISLLLLDLTLATAGQLISQNLFSRISISHRGRIFGLIEVMNLTGWLIGPIIGGWLWDIINPKAPFVFSIILELSLIPFFLIALKKLKTQIDEKLK